MARLRAEFSPSLVRDLEGLDKRRVDDAPLAEVIDLILKNSKETFMILRQSQNMQ